jgi:hypothetical protein
LNTVAAIAACQGYKYLVSLAVWQAFFAVSPWTASSLILTS